MNGDEFENGAGAEHVPEDHLGVLLQQRRVEQGRELADIAHQTRIPLRHLTAIEQGLHDNLPALPYTVGFVKSYARVLGLDQAECAERFRAETTKSDRVTPTMTHEPIEDSRIPPRRAMILGIALLVIIILGVAAYGAGWFGGDETPPPVAAGTVGSAGGAPVAADATVVEQVPVPAADTAALPPALPAIGEAAPVVIAAREDAWVKVYDRATGQSVFMGVMAAGDRYEVPAGRQDLLLQTGRAGALDITVGGNAVPPLGAATEFVKDVPLTAALATPRGD